MQTIKLYIRKMSEEQVFMLSVLVVNAGNYLYNLLLGRILGPAAFADAALQITVLLVLSFLGMTFQLTTARFSVNEEGELFRKKKRFLLAIALKSGAVIGLVLMLFASFFQELFHAKSSLIFVLLGVGVPLYFIMSVSRGVFQGKQHFFKLSLSYQTEMWSRLVVTLLLLLLTGINSSIVVAIGILFSFVMGLYPGKPNDIRMASRPKLGIVEKKRIYNFMLITAGYELSQIIINNSDVLMVKHYFNDVEAGLYSALALIGRVVYFVAWMFVMLLLPKVVQKHKNKEKTSPLLFKYILMIGVLSASIISACFLFPELIIRLMFGAAYVSMAPLLWQYALATSIFAVANIFAYYFLSLDHYLPVIISGVFGLLQIFLVVFYHDTLLEVVHMQLLAMLILLVSQVVYFITKVQLPQRA